MLLIVLLFAVSNTLTFIQRQYVPIVEYLKVTSVFHDDDYNHDISGVLKKPDWITPDICHFDHIDVEMQTPVGWQRVDIEFYDQPKNASVTRNTDESVFGIWKLKTGSYTDAEILRLDIHHKCLPVPFATLLGLEVYFMRALTTINLDLSMDH